MAVRPADTPERSDRQTLSKYGLSSTIYSSHQWQIHQLLAADSGFRSLCEDHEEAVRALEHFRTVDPSDLRVAEYEALVKGLEAEILEALNRF